MRYRYRRPRRGYWRRRYWTRRRRLRRWPRIRRRTRRTTVRKKRRWRVPKRRKQNTHFWNPATVVSCKITGWTIGIVSMPQNMEQRTWTTILRGEKKGQLTLTGGGVSVRVFSLAMLWWEHQLFRNWWSKSNDGFDLARYFGTKFYLQPNRDNDYIFWWDTDYNQIQPADFWRAHPAALLGYKNKVIIRSQQYGGNHKIKTVFVRPPATNNTEWRFQNSWMNLGLMIYGLTPIDWNVPFSTSKATALDVLHFNANDGSQGQGVPMDADKPFSYNPLEYAFYADFPKGNRTLITYTVTANKYPSVDGTQPGGSSWRYISEADDLPYWMVFYGQNPDMRFDITDWPATNVTVWFKIYYPKYTAASKSLETGQFEPKDPKTWMVISMATAKAIAKRGPFINTSNVTALEIPIMYKSYWQWGGATYSPQFVTDPMHFAPKQVTVKNPANVAANILRPWDADQHGIITEEALKRFLKSDDDTERRLAPKEQDWPDWTHDSPHPSSSEESEETPESDEEGPTAIEKSLEILRRRLKREQLHRHQLRNFFKSLIKKKDIGGG
uniref:Capsid protein n=1 Tax=Paguma larvata torque teno virus TaxID=2219036 RepID=A0A348BSN9_9VIRU|nr:hypothetical protein [Paguma larvata torque teno virus]